MAFLAKAPTGSGRVFSAIQVKDYRLKEWLLFTEIYLYTHINAMHLYLQHIKNIFIAYIFKCYQNCNIHLFVSIQKYVNSFFIHTRTTPAVRNVPSK